MKARWIMQVPALSTEHISPETFLTLEHLQPRPRAALTTDKTGVFLFVAEANDNDPPEFQDLFGWARANGYDEWIRLDPDGEVIDHLPRYAWD